MGAARAKEQNKESETGIRSSAYLPSLTLEAVDTTGFPGSSAGLGTSGITASPFREGITAAAVLKQDIWDFGRTSWSVETAKRDLASQKAATIELREQIAREAVHAYFSCVQAKSSLAFWTEIENQTRVISNEVVKFVKTGQRSIVDKYLVKNQLDEYQRRRQTAETELKFSLQYLNQVTFDSSESADCPALKEIHFTPLAVNESPKLNPTYSRIESQKLSAESQLMLAKADYAPKIVGLASVGLMDESRLIKKENYSLGLGLEFPIFEGGITQARVQQARSGLSQKEDELIAQNDEIKKINILYNERIDAEKKQIQSLIQEVEDPNPATSAFRAHWWT